MEKVKVLNTKGEELKDYKLSESVFGITPNDKVVYDAVILTRASLRQGTHKAKTRSEVSGGGRKPWRQKGTGHARQGSIRAVQWRHGGIAFGPLPRDYSIKMNAKERSLALKSALATKANEKELVVVDKLEVKNAKTKEFVKLLETLKLNDKKVLVVVNDLTEELVLASSNLQNVLLETVDEINVLDIMSSDVMLVTVDALKEIEEVLK